MWSAEKTETLSIDQIFERMNMMVACGDDAKKAKKKDKEVMAYLYEFMKMRIAFSDDHKRMWLAVVTAPDRQSFLAAQADEFMHSIQINSR